LCQFEIRRHVFNDQDADGFTHGSSPHNITRLS
jgi:hypothetical protein